MGFYIRKGFNFGPLRLNFSRSGLGASFGVKGARIGIGPRGSYIHMGRGGLYYRQTLHFAPRTPISSPSGTQPSGQQQPIVADSLQQISSSPAIGIVDSSAAELLQELNRVRRRIDLFPIVALVGVALSVRLLFLNFPWWFYACDVLAIVVMAILARNNDVKNGTVILNYSFEDDSKQSSTEIQNAFAHLSECRGVWHVEAEGPISDWKRNAGAGSQERRTNLNPCLSRPRKVECNIGVPTLPTGRKSLYFFPDRLLIYDSSGVGAVPYSELNSQAGSTRFIEDGIPPSDAQQVDTTWRYVNRNGGPDRRFNNNRQLPILLYGQLILTSGSGLNELFQYSVPERGLEFASALEKLKAENPTALYNAEGTTNRSSAKALRAFLWTFLGLMIALFAVLPWPSLSPNTADTQAAQDQARQKFADGLNQRFIAKNISATAIAADTSLTVQFTKEGPKGARRDGVEPFVKNTFFIRLLQPDSEQTLCDLGFRTLGISRNGGAAQTVRLSCEAPPTQ